MITDRLLVNFSGWGLQFPLLGPDSSLLPPNNLLVVDNAECGGAAADRICARNEFFLFQSCTGDAGSSLTTRVFNVDVQDVLVGVVPAAGGERPGGACPTTDPATGVHRAAAYARVTAAYDWVLDVTRGTTHCVPHRIFKNHYKRKLVSANRIGEGDKN